MAEATEGRLWNPDVGPQQYTDPTDKYQAAILEQYKVYVEMADRSAPAALSPTPSSSP